MAGHSHRISQHLSEQNATLEYRCDLLAKLILVLITAIAAFLLPQSAAAAPVKEVQRSRPPAALGDRQRHSGAVASAPFLEARIPGPSGGSQ